MFESDDAFSRLLKKKRVLFGAGMEEGLDYIHILSENYSKKPYGTLVKL